MKAIRKLTLLVLLSVDAFNSAEAADASAARVTSKHLLEMDLFWSRASRFIHSRVLENEFLLSSMPRISWGQIKAKYRNPNDPKGN